MLIQSIFLDKSLAITDFKKELLTFLNEKLSALNSNVSPRTVGDMAQDVVGEYFMHNLSPSIGTTIQEKFARRAMADVAFNDVNGNYVVVDVKTHNEDTAFNMPSLISVERLSRFYEDKTNFFSLLILKYTTNAGRPIFSNVIFVPIEHLDWSCLTIGTLGWGQIQIANAKKHYYKHKTNKKTMDVVSLRYPEYLLSTRN